MYFLPELASLCTCSSYTEWHEDRARKWAYNDAPLQHPMAKCVAYSKASFGEGAERFAFRFYEVAADRKTIVGPPLVAKESRHVMEGLMEHGYGHQEQQRFVKNFCQTQQFARRIANEFNKKLASLVDSRTPRVDVLDCSIYSLKDKNLGNVSTLVEPRIDHNKWHKWNTNNGVSPSTLMHSVLVSCYQQKYSLQFFEVRRRNGRCPQLE